MLSFKDKKFIPFSCWFIFLFIFVTSYSAGNFFNGANYRYVLILLIPILFISGKGTDYIISKLTLKQGVILILIFAIPLIIWPFFHKDFIFYERDWHENYYLYKNISKSFDTDCLLFKNYTNFFDNPLILSSKINYKSFDPDIFQEKHLSDIKRFKCKKFIVQKNSSLISKKINLTLGNYYIQGYLESTNNLSGKIFIFVYNLSDNIKLKG